MWWTKLDETIRYDTKHNETIVRRDNKKWNGQQPGRELDKEGDRQSNTHNRGSRGGRLVGRGRVLWVLVHLAVQNVLFDHLEFAVLARDIAVLEGDEDGVPILALKPLLSLQGGVGSSRVWVQVILEQVRLRRKDRIQARYETRPHLAAL